MNLPDNYNPHQYQDLVSDINHATLDGDYLYKHDKPILVA
jgi:hypothetical protein